MKWLFLIMLLAAIIPTANWIRCNPDKLRYLWAIVGLFPFIANSLHLVTAPVSWPMWLGFVKGIEVSVLDAISVAICLGSPRMRAKLPFKFAMTFYMIAIVIAALGSRVPTASMFYVWQIARMFLLYATVARGVQNPRMPHALLTGMTFGMVYEAVLAGWSRAEGVIQPGGTFGHQNSLGMSTAFVLYPSLALLLAGRTGWQPLCGVVASSIVVILTASRGTIGFAAIGLLLVFIMSIRRGVTARKLTVAFCGVLAMFAVVPAAVVSLGGRFGEATITFKTDDERLALKASASAILSDYPSGVGPNMFSFVSTTDGYSKAAGLTWRSTGSLVHNVYWLVAAESGYIGLLAYVLLLVIPIRLAWRFTAKAYSDQRADALAGYLVCLTIVYLQSFYEYVLLGWVLQSFQFITIGLVAGLCIQLREMKRHVAVGGNIMGGHVLPQGVRWSPREHPVLGSKGTQHTSTP